MSKFVKTLKGARFPKEGIVAINYKRIKKFWPWARARYKIIITYKDGATAYSESYSLESVKIAVAQNPLELRQWLQHAYEETLDQAIYLKRAIQEMDRPKPTTNPYPNGRWT